MRQQPLSSTVMVKSGEERERGEGKKRGEERGEEEREGRKGEKRKRKERAKERVRVGAVRCMASV